MTATFPGGSNLVLAVNPQNHTLYTGGQGVNEFSVISGLTGKVTGTIPAPADAISGAVNPVTNTLYVSTEQSVVAVNAKTGQVIATIPDSNGAGQPVIDQQTNTIYIPGLSGVFIIDGSTNTLSGVIDLHFPVAGMALDQPTNTLYATNVNGGSVWVIDTSSNTVKTVIDVGQFPRFITADPATDKIYVDNQGDHSVSVINGATNTVTATFDLEAEGGLVADPQTDTIYAADFAGDLRAVDGRTNEILVTLAPGQNFTGPDGSAADGLAIDSAAGTLYEIEDFLSSDNPDTSALSVITSCRSHVALSPGSSCANVAASFEPAAGEFLLARAGRGGGHHLVPGH